MNRTNGRWRWVFLPLFAAAAVGVLGLLGTYTHTERQPLCLTPVFSDPKGWEIYLEEEGRRTELSPRQLLDVEPGKTFYLSRELTAEQEEDGITFLRLDSMRPCSVFLNGELLYTTCPEAESRIGQVRFPAGYEGLQGIGESVRCTLPAGFAGKTLTIATAHLSGEYGPSTPEAWLTGEVNETALHMSLANHNSMPASAFATAVLLLLGLLFYSLFQGGRDWSLLLLAASAFAQVLYYLREYGYTSPDASALDIPPAYFMLPLIVILPELFLLTQMKRRRKIAVFFILITAAISLVPPVTYLFGSLSFGYAPFFETLYLGLGALLVCAFLEAGDENQVFRLFLLGLGGILTGVLVLGLASFAGERYYYDYLRSVFVMAKEGIPELLLYWCGTILFVLTSIISVYTLLRNTAAAQTQLAMQTERSEWLDYELAAQKQFYEAKWNSEEELRSLRHDMKGHFSTLLALLSDGKTPEAERYLEGLMERTPVLRTEIFCEDPYINAVLNTFASRFRDRQITYVFRIGVSEKELPHMELCLILNNALENALEASLLMTEAERSVKVQAAIRKNQLLLRVSNRFQGTFNELGGLPITTKSEKGHGYGLTNIRRTAERLGGTAECRAENGSFVLDVCFPVSRHREKGGYDHAV